MTLNPFSKHLSDQRKDPIGFIQRQSQKGNFVRLNFGRNTFLLSHPEDIKYILMEKPLAFKKSWFPRDFERFLGKSILNNEGSAHKRQRRSLQSAWMKPSISTLVNQIYLDAERVASRWESGSEINVMGELVNMGLLTMAKFVFDIDDEKEAVEIHSLAVSCHRNMCKQKKSRIPIPSFIPTKRNRDYESCNQLMDELVLGYINKKRDALTRNDGVGESSVIGQIIGVRDDAGNPLSDKIMVDELKGFFIAGSDPIRTLSWTLYELSLNRSMKENVEKELAAVLGGRGVDSDSHKQLVYINAVYSETVRKYPHAWIFHRRVNETVTLPSKNILPKGADLFISPLVMHRSEEYFPDPDKFLPQRFVNKANKTWSKGAYLPFGLGPRNCIGEHFARLQASITLAYLCENFDFVFSNEPELFSPNFMVLQAKDHVMKAKIIAKECVGVSASE
ncbi:MAG: hypothetical protein COA99_08560 [Moraxellaceae bacterium]|nr:MAG: hypothetical protein COA99_08560 [Moraxellaceae bacterium]